VATIAALEDDPCFNAGRGAVLNADGEVELDAALMDGEKFRAGAVGAVRRLRHPIQLAKKILEEDRHILLVGAGAQRFAQETGIPECPETELVTEARRVQWSEQNAAESSSGTVGAVALDQYGRIAAGTSTGGMLGKRPGRVGDSALIGCGTYADSRVGGASATGHGEAIIRVTLAKFAIDQMAAGRAPADAARLAMSLLHEKGRGQGGMILLDCSGRIGVAHNTPSMAHGWLASDGEPVTAWASV
jgi:beta-aspartyl-peptidase (threonine type)